MSLWASYYRIVIVIIVVVVSAVNDYLMRYNPYVLQLMFYITESILRTNFLFPKSGKSTAIISLLFLVIESRRLHGRTRTVSSILKSNGAYVKKDAPHFPLHFARAYKRSSCSRQSSGLDSGYPNLQSRSRSNKTLSHLSDSFFTLFSLIFIKRYFLITLTLRKTRQSFALMQ